MVLLISYRLFQLLIGLAFMHSDLLFNSRGIQYSRAFNVTKIGSFEIVISDNVSAEYFEASVANLAHFADKLY